MASAQECERAGEDEEAGLSVEENNLYEMKIEQLSSIACEALNCIGYSQDCIDERVKLWEEFGKSLSYEGEDAVVVGSKGEGLTPYIASDMDIMSTWPNVVCVDDYNLLLHSDIDRQKNTILGMNTTYSPPGYAYLYSTLEDCPLKFIPCALAQPPNVGEDGPARRNMHSANFMFTSRSGPAETSIVGPLASDSVTALRCICPKFIEAWRKRERNNDWPSAALVNEVSHLDGHVVPVGCKNEPHSEYQWRICYTFAEKRLIQSLPLQLKKVYVTLKDIKKSKLACFQELTSYLLKNVVLWVAELTPSSFMKDQNFIKLLLITISTLRNCVICGRFPSYMIAERNLFTRAKCIGPQREQFYMALTQLLEQQGNVLENWPRLWNEMQCLSNGEDAEEKRRQFEASQSMFIKLMHANTSIMAKYSTSGTITEKDVYDQYIYLIQQMIDGIDNEKGMSPFLDGMKSDVNPSFSSSNSFIPMNEGAKLIDLFNAWFHAPEEASHTNGSDQSTSEKSNDRQESVEVTSIRKSSEELKRNLCQLLSGGRPVPPLPVFGVGNVVMDLERQLRCVDAREDMSEETRKNAITDVFSSYFKTVAPTLVQMLNKYKTTGSLEIKPEEKCSKDPSEYSVIYSRTGNTSCHRNDKECEFPDGDRHIDTERKDSAVCHTSHPCSLPIGSNDLGAGHVAQNDSIASGSGGMATVCVGKKRKADVRIPNAPRDVKPRTTHGVLVTNLSPKIVTEDLELD